MKLFAAIVVTLILAGIGSAIFYQLGGYAVSFDVGIPVTVMEITPGEESTFRYGELKMEEFKI